MPSSAGSEHRDKRWAVRLVLLGLRGYKLFVSPYFRGSCRFLPSCADYAATAVDEHGVLLGGWLAIHRLARCHPLGSSGYDPVPPPNPSRSGCVPTSVKDGVRL